MKKTIYNFKGKCSHCKSNIKTENAEFKGGIASGVSIGFYTICPRCGWQTSINDIEGKRVDEDKKVK